MLKILKASAGSGKTFNLALEYIKMLLIEQRNHVKNAHSTILAITFTNKSTEEMKERIVKELYLLATYDPTAAERSKFMPLLVNDLRSTAEDIAQQAREALGALLNDFSEFNVSTIDSFFQNILRSFAYEADIIDRFGLELEDSYVIGEAVQAIPRELDTASPYYDYIKDFTLDKVNSGKGWNGFKDSSASSYASADTLQSVSKFLSTELYKSSKLAFDDFFRNQANLKAIKQAIMASFRTEYGKAKAILEERINEGLHPELKHLKSIVSVDKLTSTFQSLGNIADDKFRANVDKFIGWAEQKDTYFLKVAAKPNGADFFDASLRSSLVKIKNLQSMYPLLNLLALLQVVCDNVEEFRRSNSLILLSDTNDILSTIIDREQIPFIYDRIGVRLRHYLIDEFQDTSQMQWRNIRPLVEETLSSGKDNMVIGDVKQSIYRFRNADPELLNAQIYTDLGIENSGQGGMTTNYRSSREVVEFNNDFFRSFIDGLGDAKLAQKYANFEQKVFHTKMDGYVKIEKLEKPEEDNLMVAIELVNIKRIIDDVTCRGYRYRDVAVLVDSNSHGSDVVDYLQSQNVPIVSEDMLTLKSCPAVGVIVNMLRYIASGAPEAKEMVTEEVDPNRRQYISDGIKLSVLLMEYNSKINEGAAPDEALRCAIDAMKERSSVESATFSIPDLYALVEQVIENCVDVVARDTYNDYIMAFQDVVVDYTSRYAPDLISFLKWWDCNEPKISLPDHTDAVKVLTIHKSKGLEFPVAIVPFAAWKLDKVSDMLWCSIPNEVEQLLGTGVKLPPLYPLRSADISDGTSYFNSDYCQELERCRLDNVNKVYVAFTRAVREMYITFTASKRGASNGTLEYYIESYLGGESVYERGKPTYAQDENESVAEHTGVDIGSYEPSSRQDVEAPTDEDDCRAEETIQGEKYHQIMSFIKTANGVRHAVEKAVARGIIDKHDKATTMDLFNGFLEQEEPSRWFAEGNKVITERTITNGKDSRRVDRVVISPNGITTVVDFKFGEKRKEHSAQVREYMRLLQECGFGEVEGYVWYPLTSTIDAVSIG